MREGANFIRCLNCQAVYMDISELEYDSLHEGNFEDSTFISDITAMSGTEPNRRAWNEFSALLNSGSVLEIGPGTGHVLAAARDSGRKVAGVEASAAHRAFIKASWGIEDIFGSLGELPPGTLYDNVIMVNVVEHVYDVKGLLKELRSHLSPEARVFISTVNAQGIVGKIAGTYWAMFKERDHVSFPSLSSLRHLAALADYRLDRSWSSELPFETPIGCVVAARDYLRDRRKAGRGQSASRFQTAAGAGISNDTNRARKKRLLSAFYRLAENVDPTRHAIGALHRAATVKGILIPGESTSA